MSPIIYLAEYNNIRLASLIDQMKLMYNAVDINYYK